MSTVETDLHRRRRGCRRAPLRLGAEGHPAGPPRRARRGRARDVGARAAVLHTIVKNVESRRQRPNLVCQDTGIAVYTCRVGEHFPLHPTKIYEALRGRHRARDARAPAALERRAHDHAREHGAEHRLPPADRALGVHPRLGRARRQVRPEGLRLREHELPQDVRPRRRREGDQGVRARVDRRRRRQAVPARDRRRWDRRFGRLRDVSRQGSDRPPDRHAQHRSARGASSRRSCTACSTRPASARWGSAAT